MFNILLTFLALNLSYVNYLIRHNFDIMAKFSEYSYPTPDAYIDQVRQDPYVKNILWVTLPNAHAIAYFDKTSNTFVEFKVSPHYVKENTHVPRPDGLYIDDDGILWFGTEDASFLASFDPLQKIFNYYLLPYPKANANLIYVDPVGRVWVVDHRRSFISSYSPKTGMWMVYKTITPKAWPVEVRMDKLGRIWYTLFDANVIGYIDMQKGEIYEFPIPLKNAGPSFAFVDISNNVVWFTEWNSNALAYFNPANKTLTEYIIPLVNPVPVAFTHIDFRVFFVALASSNQIAVVVPEKGKVYLFNVPTPKAGMKDGMMIDHDNILWFTESSVNKLASMKIKIKVPGINLSNYVSPIIKNLYVRKSRVKKYFKATLRIIHKPYTNAFFFIPEGITLIRE